MFSIINRCAPSWASSISSIITPRRYDEKRCGWRETVRTSAHFDSAQKPGPSLSGCHATGDSLRSRAYASHGCPFA
ncbi:unannotated protein [freshwater metagenome]|uniref:Unannotated protein n=1 Tax=freshwater metagenome TaxID=449393 RepID=A0A6J6RUN0_9ZZZZ